MGSEVPNSNNTGGNNNKSSNSQQDTKINDSTQLVANLSVYDLELSEDLKQLSDRCSPEQYAYSSDFIRLQLKTKKLITQLVLVLVLVFLLVLLLLLDEELIWVGFESSNFLSSKNKDEC